MTLALGKNNFNTKSYIAHYGDEDMKWKAVNKAVLSIPIDSSSNYREAVRKARKALKSKRGESVWPFQILQRLFIMVNFVML